MRTSPRCVCVRKLAALAAERRTPHGAPNPRAADTRAERASIRDAVAFVDDELAAVRALDNRLSELTRQWHELLAQLPSGALPDTIDSRLVLSEVKSFAHELGTHGARIDQLEGVARCVDRCANCEAWVCEATERAFEVVATLSFDALVVEFYVTAMRKALPSEIRTADVAAVMTSLVWSKSETPRQRKRRR
jgi:hypothetical protein